jgi:5-oxoprolinase (ATP-hydrolysing)
MHHSFLLVPFLLVDLSFAFSIRRRNMSGKFQFCIDRGGTFTDVHCILPNGTGIVRKLLSEDPLHYDDAPTEGIRRILQEFSSHSYKRGEPVSSHEIESIRMGTTVATNALLERDGARMALLITKGFQDLLEIGNQARPDIFDLSCAKPSLLYERVVEIDERVVLDEYYPADSALPKHVGITGEAVRIVKTPNLEQVQQDLQTLLKEGITSLAICTMHSYTYPNHELEIGTLAEKMGFSQISLSSQVMPMVKIVSRYVNMLILYIYIYSHFHSCFSHSHMFSSLWSYYYCGDLQWPHGMRCCLLDSQDYHLSR